MPDSVRGQSMQCPADGQSSRQLVMEGPDVGLQSPVDVSLSQHACWLGVSDFMQIRHDRRVQLVDVRGRADFDQMRLPQSIHVPLYALKTRTFLRNKHVVLVGNGYGPSRLIKACEELKRQGFAQVSILEASVYPVLKRMEGEMATQDFIPTLSASEFLTRVDWPERLFVELRKEGAAPVTESDPRIEADLVIDWENREHVLSQLKSIAHKPLLIMDEDGGLYSEMHGLAVEANLSDVLFLRGGKRELVQAMSLYSRVSRAPRQRFAGEFRCSQ